ncbi:MAG: DMT family transporter [Pseudomonadota bacterium]
MAPSNQRAEVLGESAQTSDKSAIGIALIIAASLIVPFADGFVKLIANDYSALQLVWLRYGLQSLFLLPIMLWWYGANAFVTQHPVSQALRSLFIGGGALCFFSAVRYIPLADAVAVFFVQPFIVTTLAPLLLGERVGAWRWTAVFAGFLGALIVIRPGFEGVNVGTLYALGAGACFAMFAILTRRVGVSDPPMVTNFLTGLGVTLLATPAIPFLWVTPSAADVPIILTFATFGACFSLLFTMAYAYATASALAPFTYVELLGAVVAGYLMFGDLPDGYTWLGMAVISVSGLVIVWRENRLRKSQLIVPVEN